MTQEQKAQINTQNAHHSTGPKTDEGKAKVAQNATTHGLSSAQFPLQNTRFRDLLQGFQKDYSPQSLTAQIWVQELAHIAWKLEQIPSMEQQIERESGLTLAEHFMQNKPTPLTRLWNLQLRLSGRFDSLTRKLNSPSDVDVHVDEKRRPANTPVQNKPTPEARSLKPEASLLDVHVNIPPTEPIAPILQNKPAKTVAKLLHALNTLPNTF